jgi:hypothetical protein
MAGRENENLPMEGAAMGVLWLRARAQLRGQAAASLLLVVLVGVAGALVLGRVSEVIAIR